mmetsp:Transcript_24503/g.39544  ORF Transcript_24503/g.39544 Transcript_24503/m.39544 type:complete len:180 (-) Transcript_24503:31-570(-)
MVFNVTTVVCFLLLMALSYLFGRFSHLIPVSIFQRTLKNTSKSSGKRMGKYSSEYYKNNKLEHTKLILCARNDLKMGKGKLAAQCCHATLGVVRMIENENDELLLQIWRNYGQPKIVTKLDSLSQLKEIKENATKNNIPTHVVCDAGRTQIPSGSYTVLAVGPAPDNLLKGITGHLKLM